MRIRFDLDFDGEVWPGPLVDRTAVAGEAWVGPQGLLALLETMLGLAGPPVSSAVRVNALAQRLLREDGFWSRSAEVDPLGAARVLLRTRDALVAEGWTKTGLGQPRLERLAAVTRNLPPGPTDRLAAVAKQVDRLAGEIEHVDVLCADVELPGLWRDILAGLARHDGRTVSRASIPAAPEGTRDLCRARQRTGRFEPEGDGSLQLIRPQGPLTAADAVAGWMAAQSSLDGWVIVGGDAVLDAALVRHGAPAIGAAQAVGPLQVLPLVIRLGTAPVDVEVLRELLLLAFGPVDEPLRTRLVRALGHWPAHDSDPWRAAMVDASEDLRRVLSPSQAPDAYEVEEAYARTEWVIEWLRSRLAAEGDDGAVDGLDVRGWRNALDHATRVLELLTPRRHEVMPERHILDVIAETSRDFETRSARAAEVGLRCVSSPGAIAGPARCVVWWGFCADGGAGRPLDFFSRDERSVLAAAGVCLPDPAALSGATMARWRRPLLHARDALLLVCPRHGADGEAQFVHPLWDEIVARTAQRERLPLIEGEVPHYGEKPRREARRFRPQPTPRAALRVPADMLVLRESESPTSLGGLVACSLKWALQYPGRLKPGLSEPLPKDSLLLGNVVHRVFEHVFADGAVSEEEAARRARTWLDAEGPRHAGMLFAPGREHERDLEVRRMVEAARDFARHLHDSSARVEAVEAPLRSADGDLALSGRADMLVSVRDARVVVDFKWGGGSYRREELERGAAYQLASYARLSGGAGGAYYVVSARRLITSGEVPLASGTVAKGAALVEVYGGFERAVLRRRDELRQGDVRAARGEGSEGLKPVTASRLGDDGVLCLKPPCDLCNFKRLCGVPKGERRG